MKQILSLIAFCATAWLCCGAPDRSALTVVSKSPDGKSEFVRKPSPEGGDDDFDYYTRDTRNKGRLAPLPKHINLYGKVDIKWLPDSCGVRIDCGEVKDLEHWFLVLRQDVKSKLYFWAVPDLPDLEELILAHTRENRNIFLGPDLPRFGVQRPNFDASYGATRTKLANGQFTVDYAQLETDESAHSGSTLEGGLVYTFLFETEDWVAFKLLKIVKCGKLPSEDMTPGKDPETPIVLFEKAPNTDARKVK